jgi:hypothetical protein
MLELYEVFCVEIVRFIFSYWKCETWTDAYINGEAGGYMEKFGIK